MGKLKGELEDWRSPMHFRKNTSSGKIARRKRKASNEKEMTEVAKKLKKELYEQKVKYVEIDQRSKHKYSLWKKLERYHLDIDKIYDLIALRVLVENVEDCYRVLGIVHTLWNPLPGRIKDYIAIPKPNGLSFSSHDNIYRQWRNIGNPNSHA